jgi:hypothetical protein
MKKSSMLIFITAMSVAGFVAMYQSYEQYHQTTAELVNKPTSVQTVQEYLKHTSENLQFIYRKDCVIGKFTGGVMSWNTALGDGAGINLAKGSCNILIGKNAGLDIINQDAMLVLNLHDGNEYLRCDLRNKTCVFPSRAEGK